MKDTYRSEGAQITVWRSQDDGSVDRIDIPCSEPIEMNFGTWTVITDSATLGTLHELREAKLPNETGGVLVGSFDVHRKRVYIVDTIPSPPDSEEWPTLYIRGKKGLSKDVERLNERTDGMLEYIGEWHSHPEGFPTVPSRDDLQVFTWLTSLMDRDGLPALLMIVGDQPKCSCFIGEMKQVESLLPALGAS